MKVIILLALFASSVSAQKITLTPTVTIGCVDCDDGRLFGSIERVVITGPHVNVLDASGPHVRTFDASGALVSATIPHGVGPGEVQYPLGYVRYADGAKDLIDMRQWKLIRIGPDGKQVSSRKLPVFPIDVAAHQSGVLYIVTTDFRSGTFRLERWNRDSDAPASVIIADTVFLRRHDGAAANMFPAAAAPNGSIAVADQAAYRIRVYGQDGKVVRTIMRDLPRIRKSASELKAERDRFNQMAGRMASKARAEGSGLKPTYTERPLKPVLTEMDFDDKGRLWVLTGRGSTKTSVLDVFDASGKFLTEVTLPARVTRFDVEGGILAGAFEDDDGVPLVRLWRIGEA